MKKVLLFYLFFLSSISAQEHYYTFSELKGMEDRSGETHLFYRLLWLNYPTGIYRFKPFSNIDTPFLFEGGFIDSYTSIDDYEFWENDFSRFVYVSTYYYTEGFPSVYRYDKQGPVFSPTWGGGKNIELSRQDTNIIFASFDYGLSINYKSTDWGNIWDTLSNGYEILSVSPFNHNIIFAGQWSSLSKSTDGGNSYYTVDTSGIYSINFIYDTDSIHIYALDTKNGNHLVVSNNNGEPFSWTEKYSSSNQIYVSIDYSQSGSIYLADGRYIYHSTDYGLTFNEYKVLDRRIVGIYKKPNSNKLYAATKYDLYEITPDTFITLKHLQIDPDIFSWFPLKAGNKWVYNSRFLGDMETEEFISVREVTKTFLYNNSTYFNINNSRLHYRIDSTSSKIYQAHFDNDTLVHEELYLDLTIEVGDTIEVGNGIILESQSSFSDLGLQSTLRKFTHVLSPALDLRIVKNLGVYKDFVWELVGYEHNLKGAVIDGVVYGDTTLLSVENEKNLPMDFSLLQNYPNPFNPSTTLSFVISHLSLVTLKVYDILGREVAILVNEEKPAGNYEVDFNADNLSTGVYFYKIHAGNYSSVKKMIYLK